MDWTLKVGINITILGFSLLILMMLMISIMISGEYKTQRGKLFLSVLISILVTVALDMVTWMIDWEVGVWQYYINEAATMLSFIGAALSAYTFCYYIYYCVCAGREDTKSSKVALRLLTFFIIAIFVSLMINQFNGMLYYIDRETNTYYEGKFYPALLLSFGGLCLIEGILIWINRVALGKKHANILYSYVYIPIFTMLIQLFAEGISAFYVGFVLSITFIYINFQLERNKEIEMELADSRTAVMMTQIQPHFLYNSLSVIENLCVENPEQAQKAVNEFARYLRGNLRSLTHKESVPFSQELRHVKAYMGLECRRFQEDLEIVYDIQAEDFLLPPLTIQPMMENAVRHGMTDKKETVVLKTRETPTAYIIEIIDDGKGFDVNEKLTDEKEHVGIANVRTRLQAMSNGKLWIESKMGEGTKVTMEIPKGGNTIENHSD